MTVAALLDRWDVPMDGMNVPASDFQMPNPKTDELKPRWWLHLNRCRLLFGNKPIGFLLIRHAAD